MRGVTIFYKIASNKQNLVYPKIYNEDTAENKVFAGHDFFSHTNQKLGPGLVIIVKTNLLVTRGIWLVTRGFVYSAVFALLGGTTYKYLTYTSVFRVTFAEFASTPGSIRGTLKMQ